MNRSVSAFVHALHTSRSKGGRWESFVTILTKWMGEGVNAYLGEPTWAGDCGAGLRSH